MTTAVVALDASLTVTYLNPSAESLLGISSRQSIGRRLAELVHPADELDALCRRAIESGLTFGLRELAARVGDRELVVDCRAAPLDAVAGGLLLELVDAERDKRIRREIDLLAKQRLSRRIASQLAHEVKNPLGGVRGAAQLLERQLPAPELKAYTKVIIDEADRLAALVDGILKGGRPRLEPVNVHEVTEHVANLILAEKPPDVVLSRDYDPSLPAITADRVQMVQAFLNLARNALQAVGGRGRIVFRTRALSNHTLGGELHRLVLMLEVEDDGPGISDELKETIFYPLVTGRETGTGLGLTIAQDLVGRNGGLIEFTSRPGRTAFQMLLPFGANGSAPERRVPERTAEEKA